jgi:hypothetical protein
VPVTHTNQSRPCVRTAAMQDGHPPPSPVHARVLVHGYATCISKEVDLYRRTCGAECMSEAVGSDSCSTAAGWQTTVCMLC